ncbi:MAG: D-allose transport system permease protein AlsC, partial [Marmoricola sp.]|nr:D-allose transport system permease protein AlsC [Marmoricola sp.]
MTTLIAPPTPKLEAAVDESKRRRLLTSILVRQETSLLMVILVIGALAASRSSLFLQTDNLTEILRSSVIYFVMGCGAALLIIGGGLDFSAGAVFTLGGLTAAKLMVAGTAWPLAVLAGLAACGAAGLVNHLIITYLHVPPIIATLGTFFMLGGLDNLITGGNDVLPLPNSFQTLGQGDTAGVPNIILIAIAVGVLFWFVLDHTRFGVNVRALGGNREAALRNGLRIGRLDLSLYAIAAVTAGLAGIIYAARVGAGQVAAGGTTTTLNVITAVLIGGVSLQGGMGSIQGVAIG